jgi:hypothetical protein
MFKKFGFIIAIIITALGISFLVLDIIDINEDYRLNLPIATFNTIFISVVAMAAAYLAARNFSAKGAPEVLGLGGAVLAFGAGILVYGWFTRAVLNVRITVYDGTFFMAAAIHFCGVILLSLKSRFFKFKFRQRQAVVLLSYFVVLLIISAVTWLLYQDILPSRGISRDIIHGVGAVLCIASAVVYYRKYLKSGTAFYYWYSLGLMLFIFGILFASQGPLEGKLVWLGRVSMYAGGIYFLVAVLDAHQRLKDSD